MLKVINTNHKKAYASLKSRITVNLVFGTKTQHRFAYLKFDAILSSLENFL